MSAEYMHIGIPITNKKARYGPQRGSRILGQQCRRLRLQDRVPEVRGGHSLPGSSMHRNPHVAYKVDDLQEHIDDADSVICGPMDANDKGDKLAFVWKDGAILELYMEA